MEDIKQVARHAVNVFGTRRQTNIAIEELAELIVALRHYRRNKCSDNDVLSEIADIQIITEQLLYMYDNGEYSIILEQKLDRLRETLKS